MHFNNTLCILIRQHEVIMHTMQYAMRTTTTTALQRTTTPTFHQLLLLLVSIILLQFLGADLDIKKNK